MRSCTTRRSALVATVILIVTLAVPGVAGAATTAVADPVPVAGVVVAATPSTAAAKATEQLKLKISKALLARASSFNATAVSLSTRINTLSAIARRLEKAGGNVRRARKFITAAKRHLAKARSLERQTVASFKAVVSASNRTAAFAAARAKGKLATRQLKLAQADVRSATTELRAVVKRMKAN
jgi:hypothetical protein